ncbi:ABC transporter permease [Actinomyces bowdenii]|uniref:Lantibiotic ABC transporter permease n=1 Tax=Actinomyces bowdenii TaxID=131109 RepID=A0A3P1V3X5_9ACTO|nr:ABC transporter permease [Actinomyces bowdenii]RRD28892.1 lantibiotic ABC transporter permease [Actinomyces bowdenii]
MTAPAASPAPTPACAPGVMPALPERAVAPAGRRAPGGFGSLILVELVKLKRSAVWVVTVLLPLMAVVTGSVNYAMNSEALSQGWVSLSSQVTLFYSMLFFSLGVALLASAAWRVEHRGTSWNAMRTTGHSPVAVVLSKTLAIVVPVTVMQAVLVVLTWMVGMCLGLGPAIPASFVAAGLLAIVVSLPLVALQSLLSMLMRSFAAPVALCFSGCVVGFGMLASQSPLVYAIPQGVISRCLTLGSSAMSNAGGLEASGVLPVLAGAGALGVLAWGLLAVVARRTGGARG